MLSEELLSRCLRWDDARGLAGESLELVPDEARPERVTMQVARVDLRAADPHMIQFSMVLLGPVEPVIAQRTYRLCHARLGEYALLVTPIARGAQGTQYEACISHAV